MPMGLASAHVLTERESHSVVIGRGVSYTRSHGHSLIGFEAELPARRGRYMSG
jgi:hypothetical protein